jgi:hypothetical protein
VIGRLAAVPCLVLNIKREEWIRKEGTRRTDIPTPWGARFSGVIGRLQCIREARTLGRPPSINNTNNETNMPQTINQTDAPKRTLARRKIAEFPVGDVVVSAYVKGNREPTKADLRRAVNACAELNEELTAMLAAIEGQP